MILTNLIGIIILAGAVCAIAVALAVFPAVRIVLKRAFSQRSFLIVTVVLLGAALGLNAAVNFMQLHFKKEAVPLAKQLTTMPERFGTWVQVSQDQPLNHEIQDVLGTDQYIFRDYVDENVVGAAVINKFRDKSNDERLGIIGGIRKQFPTAVISLSVTYYTGMVDTVAHVPDRCVTADGYEPKTYDTVKWPIARDMSSALKPTDGSNKPSDNIEVRYINFEDQTDANNVTRSITYFFHTNGKFISSPLGVRSELANLFVKKGYYAKIEVMTTIDNPPESARVMTDFLTSALPEIHRCLPDWSKVIGAPSSAAQVAAK